MLRNGQGRNMDRFKSAMAQAKKMQQYCELKVISQKTQDWTANAVIWSFYLLWLLYMFKIFSYH